METSKILAEREAFRKRLTSALTKAGFRAYSPTELMRAFNEHSPQAKVSFHSTRKWLMGESLPTQEKMRVLAEILNVDVHWLRFGEEARLEQIESQVIEDMRSMPPADRALARLIVGAIAARNRNEAADDS